MPTWCFESSAALREAVAGAAASAPASASVEKAGGAICSSSETPGQAASSLALPAPGVAAPQSSMAMTTTMDVPDQVAKVQQRIEELQGRLLALRQLEKQGHSASSSFSAKGSADGSGHPNLYYATASTATSTSSCKEQIRKEKARIKKALRQFDVS